MTLPSGFFRAIFTVIFVTLLISRVAASTAPDVQLTTAEGKLSFAELRGQVVYVDFWASWCGPCRKSFPWMNEMQQRYGKDGFKIVAINVDADPDLAKRFLAEHTAGFTVAYDSDGVIAKQFKIVGMPSSYLIDRTGNIHTAHVGFKEQDAPAIEKKIQSLLNR